MVMKRPVSIEEYKKRRTGLSVVNQFSPDSALRKAQDKNPSLSQIAAPITDIVNKPIRTISSGLKEMALNTRLGQDYVRQKEGFQERKRQLNQPARNAANPLPTGSMTPLEAIPFTGADPMIEWNRGINAMVGDSERDINAIRNDAENPLSNGINSLRKTPTKLRDINIPGTQLAQVDGKVFDILKQPANSMRRPTSNTMLNDLNTNKSPAAQEYEDRFNSRPAVNPTKEALAQWDFNQGLKSGRTKLPSDPYAGLGAKAKRELMNIKERNKQSGIENAATNANFADRSRILEQDNTATNATTVERNRVLEEANIRENKRSLTDQGIARNKEQIKNVQVTKGRNVKRLKARNDLYQKRLADYKGVGDIETLQADADRASIEYERSLGTGTTGSGNDQAQRYLQ